MEVSKQIIEVLDYLCRKLGVVVDWSQGNVMPYVQDLYRRFIVWQIATDVFQIVLTCVIASVSAGIVRWRYRCYIKKNEEWEWDEVDFICIAIATMFFAGSVVWFVCTVLELIEVGTIPEKTLFDYVSSQMR